MRALLVVAIVVAACRPAGGAESAGGRVARTANVFGADDREELPNDTYPGKVIGKLFPFYCTATLVARDLIVTAAHCIIDPQTRRPREHVEFRAGYRNGEPATGVATIYSWWGTTVPDEDRGHDWAIARLERPVGDETGWMPIKATTAAGFPTRINLVGYSGDFAGGEVAALHGGCRLRGRWTEYGLILHDCDATRGASGGPIVELVDGRPTIVGIGVAERRNGGDDSLAVGGYDEAHANIGLPTAGLVEKLRSIQ